jgi:hypothetical protein
MIDDMLIIIEFENNLVVLAITVQLFMTMLHYLGSF